MKKLFLLAFPLVLVQNCLFSQTIPGVYLSAKVILSGPYDSSTGLMHDSLRSKNVIPLTEPYSAAPYFKPVIGCQAGETVSPAILSVTGPDAIIDWVFLELRSSSSYANIVATKRALLQRDGDIVSETDGISPVFFSDVEAGNYYIGVKHRTHLGVMTNDLVTLDTVASPLVNFSTCTIWHLVGIGNEPRKQSGSIHLLWSADANCNKKTKYNGISNDKLEVLKAVGSSTPNNILYPVYRPEDLNMDARVKYNNTNNDRNEIALTVGVSSMNNVVFQHTPN